MNPWIFITLTMAGIIFGVDFLLRRKKWKDNSRTEKMSLLVNIFSAGPYAFLSVLGLLWGIAANRPETAVGEVLYNATLTMGSIYFIVAIGAVTASLILRKKEKIRASIWVNVIALAYIVMVLGTNSLVGSIL